MLLNGKNAVVYGGGGKVGGAVALRSPARVPTSYLTSGTVVD
jgi:hypothetical protein